ncbi:MAG: hypothetical protein CMQ41_16160 [Gammaproteobacteria bacterium]|nr:hypothetical protein [Gammaproteobacteria bacterium]|tara:strand:+ start:451 stop:1353 length:903 start_codon:yes stop_codon:yes gene_type:complete
MELTKQSDIWGYHYTHLEQKRQRYEIKDEILANCIGIGAGSLKSVDKPIVGFSYNKDNGYQLLAYLTELALGFKRLPWCQDRSYLSSKCKDETIINAILNQLTEQKIDELVAEVTTIYAHTQTELKKAGLKTVKLVRHIAATDNDYAQTIMGIRDCAEILGLDYIEFEMDTLNSFSCENGAYSHLSDIQIYHEFDVSDVLYCSSLLHFGDKNSIFMESGEWVIINRSANGVIQLPIDSVTYDKTKWLDGLDLKSSVAKAEQVIAERTPFHIRQEWDFDNSYASFGKRPSWKRKLAEFLLK